jgi:hypothetical protein
MKLANLDLKLFEIAYIALIGVKRYNIIQGIKDFYSERLHDAE